MRNDIVMISLLYLHAEWLIPVFQTGGTRKASHINKDTNACLFCVVNLTLFADCIFLQFFYYFYLFIFFQFPIFLKSAISDNFLQKVTKSGQYGL